MRPPGTRDEEASTRPTATTEGKKERDTMTGTIIITDHAYARFCERVATHLGDADDELRQLCRESVRANPYPRLVRDMGLGHEFWHHAEHDCVFVCERVEGGIRVVTVRKPTVESVNYLNPKKKRAIPPIATQPGDLPIDPKDWKTSTESEVLAFVRGNIPQLQEEARRAWLKAYMYRLSVLGKEYADNKQTRHEIGRMIFRIGCKLARINRRLAKLTLTH
jgi:hypothetical protein